MLFSAEVFSRYGKRIRYHQRHTGEPVMFASVSLEGTSHGVTTDISGFYSLSRIPAGTYTLLLYQVLSLQILQKKLRNKDGKILTKNFMLEDGVVELEGAEISADREEQLNTVKMSVETIRPADLKRIPSFGGQADLFKLFK